MKLDITRLVQLIGIGMSAVQKIKDAKGKDKEKAVIELVQEKTPEIEEAVGLDFVNDAALNGLLANYIAARVALANGIANAKALKPAA